TCLEQAKATPAIVGADKVDLDQFGLISLGATGRYGPRYDICTVDPSLATESDVGRRKEALARAKAEKEADQPLKRAAAAAARSIQTLRSGGLRLLDRNRLLAACEQYIADAKQNERIKSCIAADASILQDAAALTAGQRLLVGLKSTSGDLE